MRYDSFLMNAGWMFLTAWSVVVAVVSIVAFGRDLFPSKSRLQTKQLSSDSPRPVKPHLG
jgi:hypothetical protein